MKPEHSGAIVDLKVGERVGLGPAVYITLERKSGQIARLRVVAPPEIRIQFPSKIPAPVG